MRTTRKRHALSVKHVYICIRQVPCMQPVIKGELQTEQCGPPRAYPEGLLANTNPLPHVTAK